MIAKFFKNAKYFISVLFVATLFFAFYSCSQITDSQLPEARLFTEIGSEDYVSAYQVEASAAENQMEKLDKNWYKDSSFYYIFINNFNDSNNDGYGDFEGITQKLDYIQNTVGCDSILISPFLSCDSQPSDEYFTFDTTDFYSVNYMFGTQYDLENLIEQAHKRGMKVIFDFAPNGTSKNHPWFIASSVANRSILSNLVADSTENLKNAEAKKDWYLWFDNELEWDNGRSKNNWYPYDKKYYYSAFSKDIPDLNFYNVEVKNEIKNAIRYWLNKGFDGLRLVGFRYLIEEDGVYVDSEKTHEFIYEIRSLLDEYDSKKFLLADTKIKNDRSTLELYFGTENQPEFNMLFDYDAGLSTIKSVLSGKDCTENTLTVKEPFVSACFANYLGATDDYFNRIGYIFKDETSKINQAVSLSILRTSVPFVFYGNELALDEGEFDWDVVDDLLKADNSTLLLTQNLLQLRKDFPAFRNGTVSKLSDMDNNKSILAYTIRDEKNLFLCICNLSDKEIETVSFYQNELFSKDDIFYSLLFPTETENIFVTDDEISFNNLQPNSFKLYALNESSLKSKSVAIIPNSKIRETKNEILPESTENVDAEKIVTDSDEETEVKDNDKTNNSDDKKSLSFSKKDKSIKVDAKNKSNKK